MPEKRWGAMPFEWDWFIELGLTRDLLPVVSDPNAVISEYSTMKTLGKTPSMFNKNGFVIGFMNWTERESTDHLVSSWRNDNRLGFCCQTRFLRALDVDIKDPILASTVRIFLQERYTFPIRFRADSSKFLVCFYIEGSIYKRVIKLSTEKKGPIIEFLASGQQFVVAGAHIDSDGISRDRYLWDWQGLSEPPTLQAEEFEALWAELVERFGVEEINSSSVRRKHIDGAVVHNDDIAKYLMEHEAFLGVAKDGKILFDCCWKDNHSTDNGDTQTTYMPPGGRGYQRGHFKCLHAGCAHRTDNDFLEALGYNDTYFEPLPEPVAEPGKAVALPLPPFDRVQKTGDIKATLSNIEMALERPDICGLYLRTDTFRDEIMYAPHDQPRAWQSLKDADYTRMRRWLEKNRFTTIGRELIRDAMIEHADRHRFDSAIEWLTKEVPDWDGVV